MPDSLIDHGRPAILTRPGDGSLMGSNPTVPASGSVGWAHGATFADVDGAANTAGLYTNVGTPSSSIFEAVITTSTAFSSLGLGSTTTEIDRACDLSARSVAAGASLAVTSAAHDGKTILLDTAAGCAIAMPNAAAADIGCRIKFIVSVKATGAPYHTITLAGNDYFVGDVANHDLDGATASFFGTDGASHQIITLNGTTTGGQVGDVIEVECISATLWAVKAVLRCPTGSNPLTPFS